jgi:hypothetical protein
VCGNGKACKTEGTLVLTAVSDAALATISDSVQSLLCINLGFASVLGCPLTVSMGSGVMPAPRSRRLHTLSKSAFSGESARDTASYRHLQEQDVGVRAFLEVARKRGAVVAPLAQVFGPDILWRQLSERANLEEFQAIQTRQLRDVVNGGGAGNAGVSTAADAIVAAAATLEISVRRRRAITCCWCWSALWTGVCMAFWNCHLLAHCWL